MRAWGAGWGREAGQLLAQETIATPGALPPELATARTAVTRLALADFAGRLRAMGCRDRQLRAFREAAERGVVDALAAAMVTIRAVGAPN